MSPRARARLGLALAAFFAVQLLHTVFDSNRWPFCSYNMFNRTMPLQLWTLRARLRDSGGQTQTVDAARLLPVEFFRARDMLHSVYVAGRDESLKQGLARLILARLNASPWRAFDETFASPRPSAGASFVSLELLAWRLDLSRRRGPEPEPVEEKRLFAWPKEAP